MALNIIKQVAAIGPRSLFNRVFQRSYKIYEPDYLESGKSESPLYPTLDIKISGYDFAILEKYQSYIDKIVKELGPTVEDSWAFPHKELKVVKFKSNSAVVDAEYRLQIFKRHTQVSDVSAVMCPILIRILEATLPEGVTLNVDVYDPEIQNKRYIPDTTLLDLKSSLEDLESKTK